MTFNGWKLTKKGWWKVGNGKGSADYFQRPLPSIERDTANRPLKDDGTVDTKKWIEEVNE